MKNARREKTKIRRCAAQKHVKFRCFGPGRWGGGFGWLDPPTSRWLDPPVTNPPPNLMKIRKFENHVFLVGNRNLVVGACGGHFVFLLSFLSGNDLEEHFFCGRASRAIFFARFQIHQLPLLWIAVTVWWDAKINSFHNHSALF